MSTTTGTPPVCGDGQREDPEECDDGNTADGDGCESDCTLAVDTQLWEVIEGGDAGIADRGQGIATDGAGNVYVIGFDVDTVGDSNIYVRKLDTDGNGVWSSTIDPSVGRDDRGHGIVVDGDGNLGVTGSMSTDEVETDIYVAKLDTDGVPLWSRSVNGSSPGVDGGNDVAVDSSGNFVFVGYVRVGDNDNDIWIQKTDTDGTELWTQTVAGDDMIDDRATGVAIDGDGNIYVSGFLSNVGFNKDVWVGKYDPDGNELWTTVFDSPLSGTEEAYDVALADDGSVAVAGTTPIQANNIDAWMGRFDGDTGDFLWQRDFGGPAIQGDAALGVAVDSQGNYIVVGYKGITAVDTDIWMRKYNAGGGVVWTQNIVGDGMERDEAVAVAVDGDDNILVTGEIRNEQNNDGDIWIAKFAPE
jgi:uncharacterized delta-60 repeat protein